MNRAHYGFPDIGKRAHALSDQSLKTTKHSAIFDHIHAEILSGKYKDGDRLPTEHELIKVFGTSRPTVSRALRDLQTAGLIRRRAGSGSFVTLNNKDAQSTKLFALLIPDLGQTEIFEPICAQIARDVQGHGHGLLWGDFREADPSTRREHAEELCRDYIERKVSGVFFAPVEMTPGMAETNRRIVDALYAAGIAVVLLDRDVVDYPQRSVFDVVGIDNRRGAHLLTEHLVECGCNRIAFFARPLSAPTVAHRIAGWRDALVEAGLDANDGLICSGAPDDTEFVRTAIKKARPHAFVCANDLTAAKLMHTLDDLNVGVPDDVRVVGFDDVKYANLVRVPLTTIHQPCSDIGKVAAQTMLDRIANPELPARNILIDPQLVIRKSCGANGKKEARK